MNRFNKYLQHADSIQGWFDVGFLPLLNVIDQVHVSLRERGHVGEIGVFHGKSFLPLCLVRHQGECAVGIDCFSDQSCNLSGSGFQSGSNGRQHVERNVRLVLGSMNNVKIIEGDAKRLSAGEYRRAAGGDYRIWHVDGGHTFSEVVHDVIACEACLTRLGVIVLDDVCNPEWPEVGLAMYQVLTHSERLRLLAMGYGKAVLTRSQAHPVLFDAIQSRRQPLCVSELRNTQILVYGT
jgi:hypothetical protein